MLKLDISRFLNSVDPDQLASQKPADQALQCFLLHSAFNKTCFILPGILRLDKIGEECSIYRNSQHDKV